MSLVCGCLEALALEDVSQMSATRSTHNLSAQSVRVCDAGDCAWQSIEEGGPSAARVELEAGRVQRSAAGCAVVHPAGRVLVVRPAVGSLRALGPQHAELLGAQHSAPILADAGHSFWAAFNAQRVVKERRQLAIISSN